MFRKSVFLILFVVVACLILPSCKNQQEDHVKFGASFPLTGEVASYGQKAKQGLELAVEEVNSSGGVLGRQVDIDFQDDRHDKKEAVSNITKFATLYKLPVVFGSAGSSVSLAMAPLANRYKVVQVSPISSSTQLSVEGGDYFFRTCPADDLQAEILADWVYQSGARRVAIVYTNNSWGKPLADKFTQVFTGLGGEVLLNEGVAEETRDFRTLITKIKGEKNLDAVVSPTYPKEGGVFVRQMKEVGLDVALYGGDNWGSPEFLKIAGKAADGAFYTAPASNASPSYQAFAARYKGKFGEDPDVFGAYSYDAAMAVCKAVEKAQSTDPEKIRMALHEIAFQGVSGDIAFKANGDLKSEAFARKTIKDGQAVDAQ